MFGKQINDYLDMICLHMESFFLINSGGDISKMGSSI